MVGRLPTVTGSPSSGRRSSESATAVPWPFSNVTLTFVPAGPRRRVSAARHASTFSSRSLAPSGRLFRISALVAVSILRIFQPGRTSDAASRSTFVTTRSRPTSRTSNPGSAVPAASLRLPLPPPSSADDGIRAKCERPSRPSMSRMTPRSSDSDFADAARGPSSARTAFQSRPFIVLSKCVSRMIVQAASNVSTAWGTCALTPAANAHAASAANGTERATKRERSEVSQAGCRGPRR